MQDNPRKSNIFWSHIWNITFLFMSFFSALHLRVKFFIIETSYIHCKWVICNIVNHFCIWYGRFISVSQGSDDFYLLLYFRVICLSRAEYLIYLWNKLLYHLSFLRQIWWRLSWCLKDVSTETLLLHFIS